MTTLAPQPTPDPYAGRQVLPRADPVTRLPLLILYPHSRCNCRCLMCDIWRSTSRNEMAPEALARWLDEWRRHGRAAGGVERRRGLDALTALGAVRPAPGGANRHHAARAPDCCSNAMRRGVVEFCDDVVVSLDGPAEIHDRIRNVPRAFERLARGAAAVNAAAAGAGALVALSGRCTVQKQNYQSLCAVVRDGTRDRVVAHQFPGCRCHHRRLQSPGRMGRRPCRPCCAGERGSAAAAGRAGPAGTGPRRRFRERVHRRIAIETAAPAASVLRGTCLGTAISTPMPAMRPWVSAVIEADGTVKPCFFQPSLGNLLPGGEPAGHSQLATIPCLAPGPRSAS